MANHLHEPGAFHTILLKMANDRAYGDLVVFAKRPRWDRTNLALGASPGKVSSRSVAPAKGRC